MDYILLDRAQAVSRLVPLRSNYISVLIIQNQHRRKKLLNPQKYELLRCHCIAQSHHLITGTLQTEASNLHLQYSYDNCACTVSWETKLWLPVVIK